MDIGRKIKYLRESRGWTQTELGKKLGMGKAAIHSLEKGLYLPKLDVACELCDIFEIDINELLGRKSEMMHLKKEVALLREMVNILKQKK